MGLTGYAWQHPVNLIHVIRSLARQTRNSGNFRSLYLDCLIRYSATKNDRHKAVLKRNLRGGFDTLSP